MDKKEHNLHSGRIQRAEQDGKQLPVDINQPDEQQAMFQELPKQSSADEVFYKQQIKQRDLFGQEPPRQVMPQQQMPRQQMPQQQMPRQQMPQQQMPQQQMPRQQMPQQQMPRQQMPQQQMPRQQMPQQQMPQQQAPQRTLQEQMLQVPRNDSYESASSNAKGGNRRTKPQKGKRGKSKVVISLALVLLLLVGGGAAFGLGYLDNLLNTDLLGTITEYSPKTYSKSDMVNVLIVGIDNEEGRDYGAGLGMTDMILYANFDIQNNKLNLLQIPRDSYIGEEVPTGGTGKINAALISGPDEENPINNLVQVVEDQFMLPIDHYIAMDMDGMKAIVDTFGGLRVYVPQEMSYNGSYLPEGWQWLNGDAAEFFVRNRSGVGFEQADISRLDNQRFFYSALFRRLMNLAPQDIVNLMPVFEHYCSTDIGLNDIFDLAYTALNLQAENVLFCKVPGATNPSLDPTGQGRSLYYVDIYGRGTEEDPGVANLMNQYFRTHAQPVPAEELGLPNVSIPSNIELYSPNLQVMSSVQAEEGGADINVEPQ